MYTLALHMSKIWETEMLAICFNFEKDTDTGMEKEK